MIRWWLRRRCSWCGDYRFNHVFGRLRNCSRRLDSTGLWREKEATRLFVESLGGDWDVLVR